MKETGYLEAKRNAENTRLKAISIKDIENLLLKNAANEDSTTNEIIHSQARKRVRKIRRRSLRQ